VLKLDWFRAFCSTGERNVIIEEKENAGAFRKEYIGIVDNNA
jgi:hypothetical protein